LGGLSEDIILFGQQAAHCTMALLLMASSNQQQLKCSMKFPENKLTITLGLNEHSSKCGTIWIKVTKNLLSSQKNEFIVLAEEYSSKYWT
jgi:hypothetical protein